MAKPDLGHLDRMVADWDCIVRKLVRVADGRVKPDHDVWSGQAEVKPDHDVGVESRYFRRVKRCGNRSPFYSSTWPRITGTQLPSTVASTGPSAVLRAEAMIWLGRPISTPWRIS